MLPGLSLELFKKHVRADDFAEDDDLLLFYLETAGETVVRDTQRATDELTAGGELPKPLQQAVMMLAAHWYNQRESVSSVQMHEVPGAVQALVKQYRRLTPAKKIDTDAGGTDETQA